MDLDVVAGRLTTRSQRRGLALILLAALAALSMAFAASAQAVPNTALAWGNNQRGELGDGTTSGPEQCGSSLSSCSTTPVPVSGLSGVTAVESGQEQTLALLENGTVMAWGSPESFGGSLGDGTEEGSDVPVAVCAPAPEPCPGSHLSEVTAVASSRFDNVALLKNGAVMDWGSGLQGALGNGTETGSSVPVAVSGLSEPAKAIASGEAFGLALLSNGTVMAWGRNGQGQLGNGTTTNSDVPVEVKGLTEPVTAIAAGRTFGLAVLQNGTVMAWGNNGSGQLGNGTETSSDVAVAVSGLTGAMAVAGGGSFSLALLSNAEVRAWGNNAEGELGDANPAGPENCGTFMLPCSKKPVAVCAERSKSAPPPACIALTGVTAIAAGETHSLALLSNGTVFAWGTNNSGQLGDGTSTGPEPCGPFAQPCSPIAVEVDKASGAKGIAGGGNFSVAFGPPPTVTALNPTKGSTFGGTKVGISGEDFTGATKVKFGSAPAVSFTVLSPTSISATAPAGSAGTVDVTVTNAWGTSATGSADQYTYVQGLQELPELGRCVKVAAGTGAYRRANCLPKSKTHTGEYEWLPGPGANKAFELKLSQPAFETVNGQRVVCAFLFAKGEFTGSKTLKISGQTQIQGCALQPQNLACYSNPLEPNQIVSEIPLVGELGDIPGSINPANPWLGWDLKAQSQTSPTIVEFFCGESGVSPPPPPTFAIALEGSVIGRVKPTNKMQSVFAMIYKEEHGIQIPEAFIGGVKDTLTQITTPTTNPTNKKVEQAGLKGGGELVPGEALELKAKV